MSVLLDSVIFIDHLKRNPAATAYLRSLKDARSSVVTRAEVLARLEADSPEIGRQLLDRYLTVPTDAETADFSAELRRQHNGNFRTPFKPR
jgi:predicted nucleic acid-binding protein